MLSRIFLTTTGVDDGAHSALAEFETKQSFETGDDRAIDTVIDTEDSTDAVTAIADSIEGDFFLAWVSEDGDSGAIGRGFTDEQMGEAYRATIHGWTGAAVGS
jgi:hypothetical protein